MKFDELCSLGGGIDVDCQKEGWRLAARRGGRGLCSVHNICIKAILKAEYIRDGNIIV